MSIASGQPAGSNLEPHEPQIDIGQYDGAPGALEMAARDAFYNFLRSWTPQGQAADTQEAGSQAQPLFYQEQLQNMRLEDSTTMDIDWTHFMDYNGQIADTVAAKFYRLEPSLRAAVLMFVKDFAPEFALDEHGLDKDFFISIYNMGAIDRLRDLRVEKVGSLCCFAGTVTRSSEVRPELYLGTFRCLTCGTLVKGVEQQFKYTEPLICSNQTCANRKEWSLVREESVFVDWQRVKVQESVDEVPAGSLPRTLDVVVRNKQVEEAKAGDKAVFTGSLVVVPDVGSLTLPSKVTVSSGAARNGGGSDGFTSRALGTREMTYRLMFIANSIQTADTRAGMVNIRPDVEHSPQEVLDSYEPHHAQEVLAMAADPQVYQKLTSSICPGVWGHDPIKQAVLLMLLGGVHKTSPEGMNLRGDINVAIVGDPACAKSQMLKYVAGFLPRAVYTSGKASTAAGLTASVVKEPENNEFAIEAGALMLADNGVCCIDEFDKMDVKDQVAIHEAMEQQTISITKAGIQATLNARASILAAANPVGGRYDKAKPLKYNVALPPALLSRFDLVHVMVDETTEEIDNRIAQHILRLHRFQGDAFANVHYTTEQLQRYIKYVRAIKPELSQEAADRMVHAYKELRSEDAVPGSASAYRITVRQLEALVRLGEAVARAHACAEVSAQHVDDAKRLLRSSILKIELQDVDLAEDDNRWDMGRAAMDPEDMEAEMLQHEAAAEARQAAAGGAQDGGDVEMQDAPGQENMQGLANGVPAPVAAQQAGGAKPAAGQAAPPGAAPAPKKTMKITAQKFTHIKGLLVQHIMQEQDAAEAAAAAAAGGVVEEGVRQDALMTWYLNDQRDKGLLKTEEALEGEMQLLFKVINHLIRKDQVLAVVFRPEQATGESTEAYLERLQMERVLTLHASYNPDE